jgi:type III secretory pathway component EscR
MQLLLLSLCLSVVPIFLMGCTSYLKIHIVLSFIKNALGTQAVPGALIVSILSLVMTLFIFEPVATEMINRTAIEKPKFEDVLTSQIEQQKVFHIAEPYFSFLKKHSSYESKILFQTIRGTVDIQKDMSSLDNPSSIQAWIVLLPSFLLTELKDAFRIGVLLLLPFLLVDLIICNVLAGLGMHMVNPLTIGLPLKLLLFFSSDCWSLLMKSLILSYR